MNKVDTQRRILRHLAIIDLQVRSLNRHGQNISMYTETAVAEAMTAITGQRWKNLNASSNNFPGIDLVSPDGAYGVQATAELDKAKFDKTVAVVTRELADPKKNRLKSVKTVEVIGMTCVTNPAVTKWKTISTPKQTIEIRGIALEKRLEVENLDEAALEHLDREFQGLASIQGPHLLRPDEEELRTVIIPFLERPAIRDKRPAELDWNAMQEAMLSIRRLLTQGINDAGYLVTRPYATFQHEAAQLLKEIYNETSAISALLRYELKTPGALRESDGRLIDGHRIRVQECVTELAVGAHLSPPAW